MPGHASGPSSGASKPQQVFVGVHATALVQQRSPPLFSAGLAVDADSIGLFYLQQRPLGRRSRKSTPVRQKPGKQPRRTEKKERRLQLSPPTKVCNVCVRDFVRVHLAHPRESTEKRERSKSVVRRDAISRLED